MHLPLSQPKLHELAVQARHFNEFPVNFLEVFDSGEPHALAEVLRTLVEEAAGYIELLSDDDYARMIQLGECGATPSYIM